MRASSPTSRSAPASRPIIRCISARPTFCRRRPTRLEPCARPTSSSASTGSTSPARSSRPATPTAEDRAGFARSSAAQWLEHGLSGPAAGRRVHRRDARRHGAGAASKRSGPASRARCAPARPAVQAGGRQAHGRSSGGQLAPRRRRPRLHASPMSRCPGTARAGRSTIRSIISARDGGGGVGGGPGISVGAALALQRLRPPARRRCAATAISSWASPRCGPRRITGSRC